MTNPTFITREQSVALFKYWVEHSSTYEIADAVRLAAAAADSGDLSERFSVAQIAEGIAVLLGWPEAFVAVALKPEPVRQVLEQAASRIPDPKPSAPT